MPDDLVNTQVRDAVQFANFTVMGNAGSESASMLDALMAETVGMAMYNAVNTQHNAQMISQAAVAASCARMLKVQAVPWLPPVPVTPPSVSGVTAAQSPANTYTVAGSGFATGLKAVIFQNGAAPITISGTAITNVSPAQFTMQTATLAAGNYTIEVVNPDGGQSAPYLFTVS